MAIINGRRVYDSRKIAAVAALEDRAAAEYVWMMAGISDDWGRFRASARMILGSAYKDRAGVTEADVERWLGLFNTVFESMGEHGLLRFYFVDGVRYAEWTNYMGDPPSQREHHNCPEPEWSTHKHTKACKFWGQAKSGVPSGRRTKSKPGGTSKKHLSVPPVPPVPQERTTTEPAPPVQALVLVPEPVVVRAENWNREAADDFIAVYKAAPPEMFFKQVKPIAKEYGWARTRPALRAYMEETAIEFLAIPKCLASKVATYGQPSRAAPSHKAKQRQDGLNALISGGMKGDGT